MTSRGRFVTFLVVIGFVAFLLWTTLSAQRAECSVAIDFQGRPGHATASGATEEDEGREGESAAGGPSTGSMNERIACARAQPVSRRCRSL